MRETVREKEIDKKIENFDKFLESWEEKTMEGLKKPVDLEAPAFWKDFWNELEELDN